MKLIINDSDVKEIPISLPLPSVDKTGRIIIPEILGRPIGKKVDSLTKELIARDSIETGLSQTELAKIHNTSQAEVSISSRGYDRTNIDGRKRDSELEQIINQSKHRIADSATAKLMESLDLFRPDALEHKDLPSAALKLANVVQKVSENFEGEKSANSVQFVVFAPRMRSEDSYEVIEARE